MPGMDQKNLLIAIVLSIAILLGFQYFVQGPKSRQQQEAKQAELAQQAANGQAPNAPPGTTAGAEPGRPLVTAPSQGAAAQPSGVAVSPQTRAAALAQSPRIPIDTADVHGSIALQGARLDDLTLAHYHEAVDPKSPEIVLLSPVGGPTPYVAEFGWVAAESTVKVPGPDTVWSTSQTKLTSTTPVTLSWDNGAGLRFSRTYAIDDQYMITVTQKVDNTGTAAVQLYPYGLISRTGTPVTEGSYLQHEGLIGWVNGKLQEVTYAKIKSEKSVQLDTTGGWFGVTDKYWLTSLIPSQGEVVKQRFAYTPQDNVDKYQVDFTGPAVTAAPGGNVSSESRLFAGAKEVYTLQKYRDTLDIPNFDHAVDFGWFPFLTKPMFYLLDFYNHYLGNFGLAIMALTLTVKILFFPLANKSYKAMSKMKLLQPEMAKLREKYGEDKAKLNTEMMALYKKVGANPLAGCLPIVIQIPVFFCLYKVLFTTIEMRHAPFFGWLRDLSAPDPTTVFNLFGLIPWTPPHMLMIGAAPIVMGVTMLLQQKLNPQPVDPAQARIMQFLPLIFTFMLAAYPVGLVVYWAWNNTLSMLQQWFIMRRA